MYINTIYPGFMGEVNAYGIGAPCVFLRLSGCNLRCYKKVLGTFCDTPEALVPRSGIEMTDAEIILKVLSYKRDLVCITGGEPFLQDIVPLVRDLTAQHNIKVVIETNGSLEIPSGLLHNYKVNFVVDYKTSSAGVGKMCEQNWDKLFSRDFIKFVIYNEDDFKEFVAWYRNYKGLAKVAVGLFWGGKKKYMQLMVQLETLGITDVYLNVQAHKLEMLYDNTEDVSKIFIPKNL